MECEGAQVGQGESDLAPKNEPNTFFKDYLFDQRTAFFIEEIKKYKRESLDKDEEIKELKRLNGKLEGELSQLRDVVTTVTGQRDDCSKQANNDSLLEILADMTRDAGLMNNRNGLVKNHLLKETVRLLKKDFDTNLTRTIPKKENRACQTVKNGVSQTEKTMPIGDLEDGLMTELFYLPKDPELPDLRLFEKI